MARPVERVAVVGRDAALWLTALGLRRAFGAAGVQIEAVELPTQVRGVDVYAALPSLESLHRALKLEHNDVLAGAGGVTSLGQRFVNWSKGGGSFIHAYDSIGASVNNVDFIQFWMKARSEGMRVPLQAFSIGATAAEQGRYIGPGDVSSSFSRAASGCNLDAQAYIALLRRAAVKAGVVVTSGQVTSVARDGERITSIRLGSGVQVEADLFVDASGVDAVLMKGAPGDAFESSRETFGADRLLAVTAPRLNPLPSFNQITAFRGGWIGQYPLQNRTAILVAYNPQVFPEKDLFMALAQVTGLKPDANAFGSPIAPGVRAKPWIGNCVAVGDAAGVIEPLDANGLHLTHVGLSHLISHFPVDADDMGEAPGFNRAFAAHAGNMRDYVQAHYRLNRRFDEPFWDYVRERPVSANLAWKLEMFGARGRVPMFDDEAFEADDWISLFVGHGMTAEAWDPLVDSLTRDEQIEHFQKMLAYIAGEVGQMPSLEAHLEFNMPSNGGGGGLL